MKINNKKKYNGNYISPNIHFLRGVLCQSGIRSWMVTRAETLGQALEGLDVFLLLLNPKQDGPFNTGHAVLSFCVGGKKRSSQSV